METAGEVRIAFQPARGAVAVALRRPSVARVFCSALPEQVPGLAGRLFSLCGFSQSVAARLAVLGAQGVSMGDAERLRAMAGLLTERIAETLRALLLQWPRQCSDVRALAQLRDLLAAARAIMEHAVDERWPSNLTEAVARLDAAASALGVPVGDGLPLPDTACARLFADVERDRCFAAVSPDPLLFADDPAVVSRLRSDPAYASRPSLDGRVVETGGYARLAATQAVTGFHLADRFMARLRDVRASLDQLAGLACGDTGDAGPLMAGAAQADGCGYGAVECARGRLYHQAEMGSDERIRAYRILAPTEWNFHPDGPFVRMIAFSCAAGREVDVSAVRRLAALFDPCVAVSLSVEDAGHA